MRWLIGILILLQSPVVVLVFLAGGTDGRTSSLVQIWSITIPIFLCSLYALYRLIRANRLTSIDRIAIAIAFLPAAWLCLAVARNVLQG